MHTVSMSSRQYRFLTEAQKKGGFSLQQMLAISQTTAGSIVRRDWLTWNSKAQGFVLTGAGLEAIEQFENADFGRIHHDRPLSKFIQHSDLRKKGVTRDDSTGNTRRAVANASGRAA